KATASYTAPGTSPAKVIDGNYWYHKSPPNRWTCEGSPNDTDWVALDFGTPRALDRVKLYLLDDGDTVVPPAKIDLQSWDGKGGPTLQDQWRSPDEPTGRRANVIQFPALKMTKVRAVFTHRPGKKCGLMEFEAWGPEDQPLGPAPPPRDNLAFNPGD